MTRLENDGHPLFLPEDEDDDPVAVSEIQICRMENGQQVFYPRVFQAAELRSLEQVSAELGGGSYILIARSEGRITTRRKYVLPGKPKPMYDEGRQEPEAKPTATPAVDPMSLVMGGSSGGFMPLIMLMFQQQQQASDRQMQMFMAMMENTRSSSAEDKAAARAEMQANVERERINSERMMQLMKDAMQTRPSDSNGFTQGVEFMRAFANQQVEMIRATVKGNDDSEFGALLETLGQAFQAFNMVKGAGGGLPEGVPEAVAEAAQ